MAKNLVEIRFHGRGGQGAKTAAQFLAEAAMEKGKYIQAFPEYGPERAGAPMKAFTRISDAPIRIHCGVTNPEVVVVIDPTLLESVPVTDGLDEQGVLIVNTPSSPLEVKNKLNFSGKVYTVDATRIALETMGIPMPNTPMLGALVKATSLVEMDIIKAQIRKKFEKKLGHSGVDKNNKSVELAYNEVKTT